MKLSVVICTSGRKKELNKCLRSLERQSDLSFEVVVVGGEYRVCSIGYGVWRQGKGREDCAELENTEGSELNIKWVEDPGKGLAKARDTGWREASGEYVAWIDDDVVVSKDWARNVIKVMDENPKVGGVSGPCLVPERLLTNRRVFFWYKPRGLGKKILAYLWVKLVLAGEPYRVGKIYPWGWWSPGANFKECLKLKGLVQVDYLEACNMILRRKLVEKVGGFDLGYSGTSEWCEVDLARRVARVGGRLVFSPKVRVRHEVSKGGVYNARRNCVERVWNWLRFMKGRNG